MKTKKASTGKHTKLKSPAFFARKVLAWTSALLAVIIISGTVGSCGCVGTRSEKFKPSTAGMVKSTVRMEITGYDSGQKSCNWKRNWLGQPVIASGPNKGKRKIVGQTASGVMAHVGTAAADTDYYPFGTILYVPGYGYAKVEDRGGAIKGPNRLDLWFKTEREALVWGRKKNVEVTVWKKPGVTPKKTAKK